jgi:hypothetical protein
MLEFITQNKDILGIITISVTGLFVFIKWIDSRNRELKEKRYETYMNLISVISGKRTDSTTPNLTEQIAAIWFLLEYKEYYNLTKRIFGDSELADMANEPWIKHVLPHIQKLLAEISDH